MIRFLKISLWIVGSMAGILLFGFIIGYFMTRGNYNVIQTVKQNSSLPSIEINNTLLHAESFGQDTSQVVIVLHGGPGNDYRYLLPLKGLSDEYKVVFYDQRGSGLSERVPASDINLNIFLEDLNSIVEHYSRDQKVYLIGHSWGGMLASAFIGRYPELVEKVVLAEPGFLTSEFGNELMTKTNFFMPKMSFKLLKQFLIIWLKSLHVNEPDDQASMDFFMEQLVFKTDIEDHPMRDYFCGRNLDNSFLDYWRIGALVSKTMNNSAINKEGEIEISFIDGVEKFSNKVLFIASSCNTLIGEEYQLRQMKFFQNTEMVVIQNAGHSMLGEQPEESMNVIREYFKE